MAGRMQYLYEYLDGTYADDLQYKMDERTREGYVVNTATLAHPYAFILWERAWPGQGEPAVKKDSDDRGGNPSGSSPAMSPGA
jgi:hypothetical protein